MQQNIQCGEPELFVVKRNFVGSTKKEGRKLDENIKSLVIKFYKDGKYLRIMPPSEDYVTVG